MTTVPIKNGSEVSRPQLLLVEDDPAHAETLMDLLQEAGFELNHVTTAAEALSLCSEIAFELFLVDWRLPDLLGHQLIAELKILLPGSPCILITGQLDPRIAEYAINSGADGFMLKPINLDFLLSLVEGIFFHRILLGEKERFEGVLQAVRTFRHEVSNPLQGLLGNVELLLRRVPEGDERAHRYAEHIQIAAKQLLDLLDRLDAVKTIASRESPMGSILDLPSK